MLGHLKYFLYIYYVRLRDMNNMNYEIEPILLDENYDLPIMESLMYEDFNGDIVDSGKAGDERIYKTLKWMEKEFKIKL